MRFVIKLKREGVTGFDTHEIEAAKIVSGSGVILLEDASGKNIAAFPVANLVSALPRAEAN